MPCRFSFEVSITCWNSNINLEYLKYWNIIYNFYLSWNNEIKCRYTFTFIYQFNEIKFKIWIEISYNFPLSNLETLISVTRWKYSILNISQEVNKQTKHWNFFFKYQNTSLKTYKLPEILFSQTLSSRRRFMRRNACREYSRRLIQLSRN